MSRLTVTVLAKDHRGTIEGCLLAARAMGGTPLVGDLGGTDGTADVCRRLGAAVVPVRWAGDFARARNELLGHVRTEWVGYLDPWETIAGGSELVGPSLDGAGPYRFYVLRGGLASKEVRLWRAGPGFVRPACEAVDVAGGKNLGVAVESGPGFLAEVEEAMTSWAAANPAPGEVDYYLSLSALTAKDYPEFVRRAKRFLHTADGPGERVFMSHYYLAAVHLRINRDTETALRHALVCVASCPTMAEFWCLLGDIQGAIGRYRAAASLYRNAIIMGEARDGEDPYPIDVAKYGDYPEKMIARCKDMVTPR